MLAASWCYRYPAECKVERNERICPLLSIGSWRAWKHLTEPVRQVTMMQTGKQYPTLKNAHEVRHSSLVVDSLQRWQRNIIYEHERDACSFLKMSAGLLLSVQRRKSGESLALSAISLSSRVKIEKRTTSLAIESIGFSANRNDANVLPVTHE